MTTQSKSPADTAQDDKRFVETLFSPVNAPAARDGLKADLLAAFDEEQRQTRKSAGGMSGILAFFEHFRFARAGAFASVAAFGLAIGAMAPTMSTQLSLEDEVYFYNADVTEIAFLESEEFDQWIAE